ncbi:MAG: ATP-dependent Clp protease ATP-binding subunit [Candidatus Yanofskybacteria bacterium]|nr:ATP-dependent Clp protease ATP-binding subunit [Candidatus Yanofskybacteria bacterium]
MKLWRVLFLIIGFGFMVISTIFYALDKFDISEIFVDSSPLFGLAYIFAPLGFFVLFLEIFFNYRLKYPRIRDENNLAEFLDFDAAMVLDGVNSTDGLLLKISSYAPAENILIRMGISPGQLKEHVEKTAGVNSSEEMIALLTDAYNTGIKKKHENKRITIMDLFISLFDYNSAFRQLAIDYNLDKDDLNFLATWYESDAEYFRKIKMFWRLENLLRRSPIGIGWIYGYSRYLQRFTTDLTGQFQKRQSEIKLIGRQKTIDHIEQVLARSGQNNILLVGEPGVGKRTVIMGFAEMIAAGKALPALNYKRVFKLNVPLITSSSKDVAEVQNTLISLLNEAVKAGNIVLVIDDFHNFIGALGGMGRTDISQILIPYLESTKIQIIATTDPVNFHKHMESRAEILKVFEKVDVEEPDIAETMRIIEELVPSIEVRNKVFLTYGAIKNIVEGSDRYIKTAPMPEKAIDLLAEVVSRAGSHKKPVIFPQDVDETITLKTEIPLGGIGESEKEKLINLESEMHKKIIGQDMAIKAVVQTMQRLRAGLVRRNKPAGVFLFAGPTGVGKTLTAKMLAKIYFGSPDKMLRFNMSEYQDIESLDRFLGSLRINEPGQLASQVRDNPFSLILLDEIEKAHKNILNIFLAIFDEGQMTDVFGRKVSFEQNIIIATSNAAADLIRDMVNKGFDPSAQKEKIIDALVSGRYFSPELLNRFDEIVVFHPLNKEQVRQIAELLIGSLAERLREQGYFYKPTPEIVDFVALKGFDPQFGARPMQRVIQDKLETVIARKILESTIQKGTEFRLEVGELE